MTAVEGPWIPARVMERGGPAAETRSGGAAPSTEGRVGRGYELLLCAIDENGDTVTRPPAGAVFETDCPILNSPRIPLTFEAEVLNNGVDLIGFMAYGEIPIESA